jgi:hypothetical protein
MLLNDAGTRPEPAVSVPSAKETRPAATATAEPELDPPGMKSGLNGLRATPYGERTPTSPVANWSNWSPAAAALSTLFMPSVKL